MLGWCLIEVSYLVTGGKLPIESASVEVIVSVSKALDFVTDPLLEEIMRVLKPDGKILVQTSLASNDSGDKVMHY